MGCSSRTPTTATPLLPLLLHCYYSATIAATSTIDVRGGFHNGQVVVTWLILGHRSYYFDGTCKRREDEGREEYGKTSILIPDPLGMIIVHVLLVSRAKLSSMTVFPFHAGTNSVRSNHKPVYHRRHRHRYDHHQEFW